MANREELTLLMVQIQEDFARLVRNIEQDDLGVAAKYVQTLADRIRTILAEIEKSMAADFFRNRAKSFESDLELIKRFENGAPSRAEQSDIAAAVTHFSGTIRALDNLVKLIYPREPYSVAHLVGRYRRQIATVATIVVVAMFGTLSIAHLRKIRHGLLGEYYASQTLQNLYKKRIDPVVGFRFGHGGPFLHWRVDNFSIRWTGYLRVPFGGRWTLMTLADDGVRVYLGKKLIIDDWTVHGPTPRNVMVDLVEGYYPITIEYFEARAGANMELFWKNPRQKKPKLIATEFLVPSAKYLEPDIPVIEDLDHPERADSGPSNDNNTAVSDKDADADHDGDRADNDRGGESNADGKASADNDGD